MFSFTSQLMSKSLFVYYVHLLNENKKHVFIDFGLK